MSQDQLLTADDRALWNTGFNDALRAVRNSDPNPFWATPDQVAGDKPVSLEINKEFLQKHHIDRVFAQGALAAFKEHEDLMAAKARRQAEQDLVEKKRKVAKKDDPPIEDIPEVSDEISLDTAWVKATPHLQTVPESQSL